MAIGLAQIDKYLVLSLKLLQQNPIYFKFRLLGGAYVLNSSHMAIEKIECVYYSKPTYFLLPTYHPTSLLIYLFTYLPTSYFPPTILHPYLPMYLQVPTYLPPTSHLLFYILTYLCTYRYLPTYLLPTCLHIIYLSTYLPIMSLLPTY